MKSLPAPALPFRDQALQSPDTVERLFDSNKMKQALHSALIEYATQDDDGKTYLSPFQNQPDAIVDSVNTFASLAVVQLKMEGDLEKIQFQFQNVPTPYAELDDGIHIIYLPIKEVVMSVAADPTSFSWLAWAIAHELFHVYIRSRYKERDRDSSMASLSLLLYGNPNPYRTDLVEIACELYAMDFLRQLAAHLDGKKNIHAAKLRNKANEVESEVRPRIADRFVEVAAATA